MNALRKFVSLAVIALIIMAAGNTSGADSPCLPPSSAGSEMLFDYQFADTTTDQSQITWRQAVGLPTVAVTQITLVTDTTLCRRAVTAFNSILAGDSLPASVAVNLIRYGSTRYVIGDPAHTVGEWVHEPVVDTSFTKVKIAAR